MSTTARKLRKTARREAGYPKTSTPGVTYSHHYRPFQHPAKKATPVGERLENQPREIFGKGPTATSTRFGLTSAARRRLTAAGLVIDGDTVKQPGWFRRLFGTGSAAA